MGLDNYFKIFKADGSTVSIDTLGNPNNYDGEKVRGELSSWDTYGYNPNNSDPLTFIDSIYRQIALYTTNPFAVATINKPLDYSIGHGVMFRSYVNADFLGMTKEDAKAFSNDFTELLHLEKLAVNYYEKQDTLVREAKITGDSLLYFLREKNNDKPFDLIVAGGWDLDPNENGDGFVLGVAIDDFNRRQGIYRSINGKVLPFRDNQGNQNVIMMMFQERPGQLRGYGTNRKVISQLKKVDRVWDATISRMVQEAIQMGYFQASSTDVRGQAKLASKMARGLAKDKTETTVSNVGKSTDMSPGNIYVLENEESLKFTDPKAPSNNFGTANEWFLKLFSMASGYPPEFIMSEYSTSYTAHKGALNDAWKKILKERSTFTSTVDRTVNWEYLKHFIKTGQLKLKPSIAKNLNNYKIKEALLKGTWLGEVPGHINPLQEIRAYQEAEKMGYVTKSQNALKFGNALMEQMDEWEEGTRALHNASPEAQAEELLKAEVKNENN